MSDAFERGLEQLLAAFDDVVVTTEHEQPLAVVIEPGAAAEGAAPLVVRVDATSSAIAIDLGGWVHTVARSDADDDEAAALALDLVAAALIGRMLVVRASVSGGRTIGHEVTFVGDRGALSVARTTGWRWPWQSITRETLRNAARVPSGLALGESGLLPTAPWSGLLALPEQGAAAAALPIDGELDLHNFSPKEVDPLVRAYIDECLERGIVHLRIVHGKGIGALRRTVQAILSRHPEVESQRLGGHGEGSWGATIVKLRARS